jgi:hypothetical protein
MKFLYWLVFALAALAFWLGFGWVIFNYLIVDPYYDKQIDVVINSAIQNAPSKKDVAAIEQARSSMSKIFGVGGGVLCGFAFGVIGQRLSKKILQVKN